MAITINLGLLGDGTYTIEDDGIPGNGTSIVRDPLGSIVTTFLHPADSLTILSRAGQSIDINIVDSLTTANFTVGSLTVPAVQPDSINVGGILTSGSVTLAAREAVSEWGSDGATDIVAGSLLIDAGTGVGVGNAIETQVSFLEVESVAGDIELSNINNLQIGGVSGELRGLRTGISGDIILTNQGSILLSDIDGVESARSAGNLTLTAIGAAADISSNVNRDALLAVDNIVLTAGRDVSFGTVGADFDNDVRSGGGILINAGRDFTIDGFSDMAADDQGQASGGGVTITAGRDINVEDNTGVDASVGISGSGAGSIVLTTGFGGTLRLAANSPSAVFAGSGGVVLNADRLLIEADSGVTVSGGGTATVTTSSAGRAVNIGSATDGGVALELSDAELDRVSAQSVVLGGTTTGNLAVVGALTSTATNLQLKSGGNIVVQADITAPTDLSLRAAGNITQQASSVLTANNLTARVDTPDNDSAGNTLTFSGAISAANSVFFGNTDGDTLNGSAGADEMRGGAGNDTYIVNNVGDQVIEVDNAGTDLVNSSVSFSLAGQFAENMTLTGAANIDATGNTLANTLTGNSGNNTLDGLGGIDTLVGLLGNDTYVVDNFSDVIVEAAGEGIDTVQSFVSHALGANFENLVLTGTANTSGIGNDSANSLTGNTGNNTLNGGVGADTLAGGAGNDTYIVDNVGDVVNETSNNGTDLVRSSISFSLGGKQAENLTLTGTDNLDGTGNSLVNTVIGNSGNNVLSGAAGADTLIGLAGNDTYIVDNAGDSVVEANVGGIDLVRASVSFTLGGQFAENLTLTGSADINGTGNSLANTIVGNGGDNLLNGATGSDSLTGDAGADTFVFKSTLGSTNIDSITDFNVADDTIQLFSAIFNTIVGTGSLSLAQFTANASGTALDASDRIIYETDTGNLFFDSNGNAAGGSVQFAELAAGLALTANDFLIVT